MIFNLSETNSGGGGGGAVTVVDTPDSGGGTIRSITAVDISSDTVTAGSMLYGITAHEHEGTAITGTIQSQAAQTITPTNTAQTIAAGKYLAGTQTIEAVTTTNLSAANIVSGVTVKVGTATDDDSVASVTGTASGSSSFAVATYNNVAVSYYDDGRTTISYLELTNLTEEPVMILVKITSSLSATASSKPILWAFYKYNNNWVEYVGRGTRNTLYVSQGSTDYTVSYANGTLSIYDNSYTFDQSTYDVIIGYLS